MKQLKRFLVALFIVLAWSSAGTALLYALMYDGVYVPYMESFPK